MQFLQKIKRFSFLIGIGLTLLSVFFIYTSDAAIRRPTRLTFPSQNGDRLFALYYLPKEARNYGVLMLEGFSSDQMSMRTAANEFAREGFQVFSFDFSGQGRSEGTLTLDNASTSVQSREVKAALEAFQIESGLEMDHIFLFGHSMGARAAVQTVVENDLNVAGLMLLGPQIQVDDDTSEWITSLDAQTPDEPILILSGTWEDVLPVAAAQSLMKQLTGENVIENGKEYHSEDAASRQLTLVRGILHIFEPYSPKLLNVGVDWAGDQIGVELNHTRMLNPSAKKIIFWFSSVVGVLLFLSGASTLSKNKAPVTKRPELQIVNRKAFVWSKYWLWLPAAAVGAVITFPFLYLGDYLPLFNLYFFVLIGGYGVLSMVLYLMGKMPGVDGKLVIRKETLLVETINWRYVLGLNLLLLLFLGLITRTGWFWMPPLGKRFLWVILLTPFTTLGFWTMAFDRHMLEANKETGLHRIQFSAILPFVLMLIGMALMGSWSGMIYSIFGLLTLWIVYQQGLFNEHLTASRWLAALFQAILLFLMILPQGALFTL